MPIVVRVKVENVALDEGMWCRTCALPSGVRVWFTSTIGPVMALRFRLACRDCGGRDVDGSV